MFTPEEKRDQAVIAAAEKGLRRPLRVLDRHLEGRSTLLGGAFSIADLNVSAVMLLLDMVGYDYAEFANARAWAVAGHGRAALVRARAKK